MRLVTSNEIKMLDQRAIKDFGINSLILMERAGISTIEVMWNEFKNLEKYSYAVFCGPGNNGGDGLVIARELLNYTEAIKVILMSEKLTSEATTNLNIFKSLGGEVIKLSDDNILEVVDIIKSSDIIIDAIFGVGLSKNVEGIYAEIINFINLYSNYTVSVDIPSGISADTGKILGTAIRSDLTVTFEFPKIGHILFPGREFSGKLKVVKIGIPKVLQDLNPCDKILLTKDYFNIPKRFKESNKGTYGKVVIIGGSKDYIGAPVLSSIAAIRSGAGKVILFSTEKSTTVALNHELGIIPITISKDYFDKSHIKLILPYIDEKTSVVIGPGIGRNPFTEEFTVELLKNINSPAVIDADAISLLRNHKNILSEKKNIIITPHPGELSNFLELDIDSVKYNYKLVKETAEKYNLLLVLKDVTTIISDGEKIFFNVTGNTSLSKGGSGDILSGLIGGFLAQSGNVLESSLAAVYILGIASELYEYEGYNLITEILNNIPKAIAEVKEWIIT